MPRIVHTSFALLLLLIISGSLRAQVCVHDDAARQVCLPAPAQRVVALSPGVTELLFAAGAGAQLVAAVSFSDYPDAAKKLPRVGSHERVDLEAIAALQPDLIVTWGSGNPSSQIDTLLGLGLPVFFSEPQTFSGVADTLTRLGVLTGQQEIAEQRAQAFEKKIATIQTRYADAETVSVFYQVWETPLMTVNGKHFISQVIQLCGGENIFSDHATLVPRISREAVLAKNPQAIVVGGESDVSTTWLTPWQRFTTLRAVQNDFLFFVSPSLLQRPSPRLADGAQALCEKLERVRHAK